MSNCTPAFRPGTPRPDGVTPVSPVPRLAVSLRELSQSIGVSERTAAEWVRQGTGPRSFLQGRLRLFALSEVQAWLESRTREAETHRGDAPPADDHQESPEITGGVPVPE